MGPQREVLFVSLTFSLSPQPQRAVLVVSLSLCLFVSLTNKKKCVSPSKRSSLCLFDFSPLPPTSTSSARCLFVSLSFPLSPQLQRAVLVVSLRNKHEKEEEGEEE